VLVFQYVAAWVVESVSLLVVGSALKLAPLLDAVSVTELDPLLDAASVTELDPLLVSELVLLSAAALWASLLEVR